MAMGFQNYALYSHLTVAENIAFLVMARGAKRADVQERIDEVATALEIMPLLGRKPKEFLSMNRFPILMRSCEWRCARNCFVSNAKSVRQSCKSPTAKRRRRRFLT
jgi:hypothetical protein